MDLEELAMEVPGVHPGRVVAFGIFNEEMGTEDVVLIAETNSDDPCERDQIAAAIRETITRGSAVAVRSVHIVDRKWLIKTSRGTIARGANGRNNFLKELEAQQGG